MEHGRTEGVETEVVFLSLYPMEAYDFSDRAKRSNRRSISYRA